MELHNIQVLYDFAIYNCLHFGSYTELIYEDQQLQTRQYSNIELAREATQLAAGLRSLGIKPGDRVLVMMPNCPEVVIAYQAIARVGAVLVPILSQLKEAEVQFIAMSAAAKAILTDNPHPLALYNSLAALPTAPYIIYTGITSEQKEQPDTISQLLSYEEVVARGTEKADHYLTDLDGIKPAPDDIAVILYTSGTTGNPKGVTLTHRKLVSNAIGASEIDESAAPGQGKRLVTLPLAHAFGILTLNASYLTGAQINLHSRFNPYQVLSAIERYRITTFAGVPATFVALLSVSDGRTYDTRSLQYCSCGSAPLPVPVLESFQQKFNCQIREGYGLSEVSASLTVHRANMLQKPGSVGKPLPNVEILIVDEQDNRVPPGALGEIIARGPNIMSGYYNFPEETRRAMRNGWLHTGDIGRFDEDGYLYIVERKKDLIIRGGLNIYPRDIEEVLVAHPAVLEAAVIGIPSERMGEEVKAFVAVRSFIDAEMLMAYCREKLANYKTPSQIEFIQALPRNALNKIDKKELRKRHTLCAAGRKEMPS
ncbi:AMP-binding protein [Ktedonosporobacter rubrisoli]|nr:AMP-binding protein [Ktedonosporobacter rubrisoli]